ncbi:MAG: ABC transporter ATP-binding protein [Planctomycetota bacterium]
MIERHSTVVNTAGLCKTFKDFWRRARVEAVKDLNLEIRPGEVFGLLGPNGSGKSTTIKMLLGLLYPTRGRIAVFGKSPTDVAVKARIGFLPEESYLYRFLVAHETLDYFGQLFRLPKRVRRERTHRLLDMVGLQHEAKRPLGEYSKGMARRIGLAQALINDPEFLILDEPTSGLDPIGARQIKDVIRELGKKGKTILLSSHMLADVEDVCDRVTILYGGQQRAAGDIRELLSRRDVTQITSPHLDESTLVQVRDLIRRLEGKDILEVSSPRVRLEDFFLQIVSEAQAADVRTYGARAGGEIPDFLKQPTEGSARGVVDSLVDAAAHPTGPVEIHRKEEPSKREKAAKDVLNELLGANEEPVESVPAEVSGKALVRPEQDSPRPSVRADENIIRSLLGQSGGPSEDGKEKKS